MATPSIGNRRPGRPADGILARGEQVALRELRWKDLDEMERWPPFAEPELQWANNDLSTPVQRQLWYRHEMYDPTRKRLAILLSGRLIGVLGLRNLDYKRGRATIGIRLSAAEVDRGYGSDAIRALYKYAFGKLGLKHLDLDVAEHNLRAQHCYLKCGFHSIGEHRDIRGNLFLDLTIEAAEANRQNGRTLPS
ncbi:MAG: GNAT family N-acetyltransferase [Chloroflexi bacterium]|nr:GNAT family N-acetyltransferase [Chloroflexota bacterium]MCL5107844.1 GNAT family N-acetyltransferase [Chloroflexota bacterium]